MPTADLYLGDVLKNASYWSVLVTNTVYCEDLLGGKSDLVFGLGIMPGMAWPAYKLTNYYIINDCDTTRV